MQNADPSSSLMCVFHSDSLGTSVALGVHEMEYISRFFQYSVFTNVWPGGFGIGPRWDLHRKKIVAPRRNQPPGMKLGG